MVLSWLTSIAIETAERGWIPDELVRLGIRQLLRRRLREQRRVEQRAQRRGVAALAEGGAALPTEAFLQRSANEELALATEEANQQHYEVPVSFFNWVLGPRKKYSCCYFENPDDDLATAEERALELTTAHAELRDGMEILELGCGWGSWTLWMLERFPNCRVVALSNSHSQRAYIERQAAQRGVAERLSVVTEDIRRFATEHRFDRVVSVEMFEHVRNHGQLLARIGRWLRPEGKLFVHIFCHREWAYPFEARSASDWMARHFFTGGMMPNRQLFRRYPQHFQQVAEWLWNGRQYERTCRWWIANMERHRRELIALLSDLHGPLSGARQFQRWKLFFKACAELFGFRDGNEWLVGHFLLQPVTPQG